jgi:hypothetical protein
MTQTQIVLTGAILGLVFFLWAWWVTYDEVERKRGREPTWREIIFAVIVSAMAPPASVAAVFAYVWWIMPEANASEGAMIPPRVPADSRGA